MNRSALKQLEKQNAKSFDQMKFRRVKKNLFHSQTIQTNKENSIFNQSVSLFKHNNTQRDDYLIDQNRLLKQQNMHLKELIKTQKTKLLAYKEQERVKIFKEENNDQSKLIRKKYFQLKQAHQSLKQELQSTKKSYKFSRNKQLEYEIQQCYQQIKRLTALLKNAARNSSHSVHSTTSINEINKIIQSQHLLALENKELRSLNQDHKQQIDKQIRLIRNLKNIVLQKQKKIDQLMHQAQQQSQKRDKKVPATEMVPKHELDKKKKEIISLTQTVSNLQRQISNYETKIQQMKQEQTQAINREILKRKQLMVSFEKLEKSKQALEEALVNIKKKNDNRINLSTIMRPVQPKKIEIDLQQFSQPFKKKKSPQVVRLQHIQSAVELMIFNLQKNGVDSDTAIKEMLSDLQVISIGQIQYVLEYQPFQIDSPEMRQIFARYLIQGDQNQSLYIDYDYMQSVSVVKSILKRIFNNFHLFSEEDEKNLSDKIEQYQRDAQFNIRAVLIDKKDKSGKGDSEFQRNRIINVIHGDQKVDQKLYEFIKFKSFKLRQRKVSLSQFFKKICQKKISAE